MVPIRTELVVLGAGPGGYAAAFYAADKGKRVVLVALTGWWQDDDRRKSQDAGFDVHMVKPIEPAALERLVTSSLAEKRQA